MNKKKQKAYNYDSAVHNIKTKNPKLASAIGLDKKGSKFDESDEFDMGDDDSE